MYNIIVCLLATVLEYSPVITSRKSMKSTHLWHWSRILSMKVLNCRKKTKIKARKEIFQFSYILMTWVESNENSNRRRTRLAPPKKSPPRITSTMTLSIQHRKLLAMASSFKSRFKMMGRADHLPRSPSKIGSVKSLIRPSRQEPSNKIEFSGSAKVYLIWLRRAHVPKVRISAISRTNRLTE